MENNNKNSDLKYDDSYDETVGFFSNSFYRKEEFNKGSEDADVIKNESHIENTNGNSEESSESPVSQLEKQENDIVESITENEDSANTDVSKSDNEGTYNAFTTKKNVASKVVENSATESAKKEQPVIEVRSDIQENNEKDLKLNSSEKIVAGIDYSFFSEEKNRIAKENAKKKNMYITLSIICAVLTFIIFVPLLLLPVFIFQCIKYSKNGTFSTFLNYDTLKWKEIKGATSYEIYVMVDNNYKFKLFSTESQPKCSLPRGTGYYLIVAKKDRTIIAVSDVISVSV